MEKKKNEDMLVNKAYKQPFLFVLQPKEFFGKKSTKFVKFQRIIFYFAKFEQ
jgi:hypothetical protein